MKKYLALTLMLPYLSIAAPKANDLVEPTLLWSVNEGLKNPESVVYDATTKSYYVSNVNGAADAKDGNGFITQISEGGKVTKAEWVAGLNAPKGLALKGNSLWVSDIDELVEVDVKAAKVVKKVSVSGAIFLNDVAATDTGLVFVTDTLGNQIYKYDGKAVSPLSTKVNFESPNGIFVDGNRLVVASWGFIKSFNEAPRVAGKLFSIAFDGTGKKAISKSFGNLDGLEKWKDSFVVSDWVNGKLYTVTASGKIKNFSVGKQGTADIAVTAGASGKAVILVPQMMESKLFAYEL